MKTIARILLCILFIVIMTKIFNTDFSISEEYPKKSELVLDFSISSESKHGIVLAKN